MTTPRTAAAGRGSRHLRHRAWVLHPQNRGPMVRPQRIGSECTAFICALPELEDHNLPLPHRVPECLLNVVAATPKNSDWSSRDELISALREALLSPHHEFYSGGRAIVIDGSGEDGRLSEWRLAAFVAIGPMCPDVLGSHDVGQTCQCRAPHIWCAVHGPVLMLVPVCRCGAGIDTCGCPRPRGATASWHARRNLGGGIGSRSRRGGGRVATGSALCNLPWISPDITVCEWDRCVADCMACAVGFAAALGHRS
jgi:hypothetical protein